MKTIHRAVRRRNGRRLPLWLHPVGLAVALAPLSAVAAPTGEEVVAGNAGVERGGNTVTIRQLSERAIINWCDFSSARGEMIKFVQPSAASATLNRVTGGNPSALLGDLQANGQVYLINPNGIIVGQGARIDAHSFVASTLDVSDDAFMAGGELVFSGSSSAAVVNLGAIRALGGDVFLIAQQVRNDGTIDAANGTVGLAGGTEVLLKPAGEQRLFVRAASNASGGGAMVDNAGAITAAQAELTARGGNVYALAINNDGVIRATGAQRVGGRVLLTAPGGNLAHRGVIDASGDSSDTSGGDVTITADRIALLESSVVNADGDTGGRIIVKADTAAYVAGGLSAHGEAGDGGFIETSGGTIHIRSVADVGSAPGSGRGGTWLIDPNDITIVAGSGASNISGTTVFTTTDDDAILGVDIITSALAGGGNVVVQTSDTGGNSQRGNITLTTTLNYNAAGDATLTLIAHNHIILNGEITQDAPEDDRLNLFLNADSDSDGLGAIFVFDNIKTGGGSITFSGPTILAADVDTSNNQGSVGGDITFEEAVGLSKSGGVTITTTGSVAGDVVFQSAVDSLNSYTLVAGTLTWNQALVDAQSGGGADVGDTYLMTITSALERNLSSFIADGSGQTRAHIGASDAAAEGEWRWITGPEGLQDSGAGLQFWQGDSAGSPVAGQFEAWFATEPNDSGGIEDAAQFDTASARWTDVHVDFDAGAYLQETNEAATALTIDAGTTGLVVFDGEVGSNKAVGTITVSAGAFDAIITADMAIDGDLLVDAGEVLMQAGAKFEGSDRLMRLRAAQNVQLAFSNVTTTGSNLQVELHADADGSGGGAVAVVNSDIFSAGGDVLMGGGINPEVDVAVGTGGSPHGVMIDNSTINAGGGDIVARGMATPPGGSAVHGVLVTNNTLLTTGGNGSINLFGLSTALAGSSCYGVAVLNGSTLETFNGDLVIDGFSGGGSDFDRSAVGIRGGALLHVLGSGLLDVEGRVLNGESAPTGAFYASTVGSFAIGLVMDNGLVRNDNGEIRLRGDSHGTGAGSFGLSIENASQVVSTGAAPIRLDGLSVSSAGAPGINIPANATIGDDGSSTYTGDIILTAGSVSSDSMVINPSSTIRSTGFLMVQPADPGESIGIGDGASGTLNLDNSELSAFGDGFITVIIGRFDNTGALDVGNAFFRDNVQLVAGQGDVTVTGLLDTGFGSESASISLIAGNTVSIGGTVLAQGQSITLNSDHDQDGFGAVVLHPGAAVVSNGGQVTLGGGSDPGLIAARGTSADRAGVRITSAVIDAGGGDIFIHGIGADNVGGNSAGVLIEAGAQVVTAGFGSILIDGIGGGSSGASLNHGVSVINSNTLVAVQDGQITLIGDGGAGSIENFGVNVNDSGSVESGAGHITLDGAGGDGSAAMIGVAIDNGGFVKSSEGFISVFGQGGTGADSHGVTVRNGSRVESAGSAGINIHALANAGTDALRVGVSAGGLIGGFTVFNSGDITLIADSMNLDGATLQSTGFLTIHGSTPGLDVGLGIAGGGLSLDASELAAFQDGFAGILFFGGDIAVSNVSFADPVQFLADNAITVSGTLAGFGDAAFVFAAPGGIQFGATVQTFGGNVIFQGPTGLATTAGVSTLGGAIIFDGPVDGPFDLDLNADTGHVHFGPLGQNQPLQSLAVKAGSFDLGSITVNNGVLIDSYGSFVQNPDAPIHADSLAVIALGSVEFLADNQFNALAVNAPGQFVHLRHQGDLHITTLGPVAGIVADSVLLEVGDLITQDAPIVAGTLEMFSPNGVFELDTVNNDVDLLSAHGLSLAFRDDDGFGIISLNLPGDLTLDGIASGFIEAGGNLTITGNLNLTGDLHLNSPGNVTLTGTVDGAFSLFIEAGGDADVQQNVGSAVALSELSVFAGDDIDIADAAVAGLIELVAEDVLTVGALDNTAGGAAAGMFLQAQDVNLTGNLSGLGILGVASHVPNVNVGLGNGAAGQFKLTTAEIGLIQNGFEAVHFALPGSAGRVDVRAVTFHANTVIEGSLVTFNGAVSVGGDLSVFGRDVRMLNTINASGGVFIGLDGRTLAIAAANATGGGTVTLNGAVNAAEGMTIHGAVGADKMKIRRVTSDLTILGGDGNDYIHVASATNTLNTVTAPIFFDGGDGVDSLTLCDLQSNTNNLYLITSTSVVRDTGNVEAGYASVEYVKLQAGRGVDTVQTGFIPGVTQTILAGPAAKGDFLHFDAAGAAVPAATSPLAAEGFGTVFYSRFGPITIDNIEGGGQIVVTGKRKPRR